MYINVYVDYEDAKNSCIAWVPPPLNVGAEPSLLKGGWGKRARQRRQGLPTWEGTIPGPADGGLNRRGPMLDRGL